MEDLDNLFRNLGIDLVASRCGVTRRAVTKWMAANCLPRTEHTGETAHWRAIKKVASEKGLRLSKARLLARPTRGIAA